MINDLIQLILMIVPLLFAVTIHEAAHGCVAYLMGDDTAKNHGRLTLNPVKHLDLFGSFILPILLKLSGAPAFGYAKPVPINPFFFRNYRLGMILVSAAGVTANFLCAVLSGILVQLMVHYQSLWLGTMISPVMKPVFIMIQYSVLVNLILLAFNLIPVPPLDGSKILAMLLPESLRNPYERINKYGMIILFILIVTDSLDRLMSFIVNPLLNLLLGR